MTLLFVIGTNFQIFCQIGPEIFNDRLLYSINHQTPHI